MRILRLVLALVVAVGSGTFATGARATVPGPVDVNVAPPPLAVLPSAGEASPPVSAIVDPIEPRAVCGEWHLQTAYGGLWPTQSTWWQFECVHQEPQCTGQCNADWGPYVWVDYFYWDGSRAVFYGEFFGDFYFDSMYSGSGCSYWWDAPTSQWYLFDCPPVEPANDPPVADITWTCSSLTCTFDGGGSSDSDGSIVSYAWGFGDGQSASGARIQHTYGGPGEYAVTLIVTDDRGASGRSTEAFVLSVPNVAPTADFTMSCAGVQCTFDGGPARDLDGTIVSYHWTFGDGVGGAGKTIAHVYDQPGPYTVTLTVVDDGGVASARSRVVALISLHARAYKVQGLQHAELSWTSEGGRFDLYRNGLRIATVEAAAFNDALGKKGAGTYIYRVCAVATSICSSNAIVSF